MDPFIGEIRIFAGSYPPAGWAFCDGQILSIQQNTALFSLLGTTYGGDGRSTFALPNLQGRAPMHQGAGPGLSAHWLGESGGAPTVTLAAENLPQHTHAVNCLSTAGNGTPPTNRLWAAVPGEFGRPGTPFYGSQANTNMNANIVDPAGAAQLQPHDNMQPYLGIHFIIALQGVFPPRQ